MPTPIQGTASAPSNRRPPATYTVQAGDSLSAIAGKTLGTPGRWKEIYELNREQIGPNPGLIRVGMVLRLPGAPAAPRPVPQPTPAPVNPRQDSDRDGLIDRYDAAPRNAGDRRWNQTAAEEFATFVDARTAQLRKQGIEIDCADFAVKLLKDFCDAKGIPNPLADKGTWHTYTPQRNGGLPNVEGPTFHLAGIHADNLAKVFTRRINDADGDGIQGYDPRTGKVDVDDLRPGDILFYDWEQDGVVNHTINVTRVDSDGTVTLSYGTYNNLRPDQPLRWENLDFLPIRQVVVKPGTEEHEKWFGEGNKLWGVRRYTWMPDHHVQPTRQAQPVETRPAARPAPFAPAQAKAVPALEPPSPPAVPEAPRQPGRWERLMQILTSA